MKSYFIYLSLVIGLTITSCGSDESEEKKELKESKKEEPSEGFIKRTTNSVSDGFNKATSTVYSTVVKTPVKYFENRSKKADSISQAKIDNLRLFLESEYEEYAVVSKWFESDALELGGTKGNYYKIIDSEIDNGNTITRKSIVEKNENGAYRYFYETEDDFYIYELGILEGDVFVLNIRRIHRGMLYEKMHDLFYEDGILKKELYQCEVDVELYEKDGDLYFEQYLKNNGKKITNTIKMNKTIKL